MINGKTVLAIIPARGGSKGIPRKNIKTLAGKPLIAWTILEAKKSKYIDRIILSSDDDEIIKVSTKWGCEVPFVRPKELAKDDTPGIDPVIHAINTLDEKYDFICLLQPTSPLRKSSHIDDCIEMCVSNKSESCISVQEVSKHPHWMFEINDKYKLTPLFKDIELKRRQDANKIFVLNGAIYFAKSVSIVKKRRLIFENSIAFRMDKISSIDIDDSADFLIADLLLRKRESDELQNHSSP